MRNPTFSALVSLALAGAAGHASAAAFTNGSFELPGGASVRERITTGTVPGWTYVSNNSYDIYESDNQDGLPAANGTHYVSFGHNGTYGGSIFQTFNTVVGSSYTVTYAVAEQQGNDPSQVMRAIVSNGAQTLSADNTNLTLGFLAGTAITFVAQTDLTTLTFLDATPAGGGGASNLALDAVAINGSFGSAGGVPEPAAWSLMLLGVGGVGALARRRGGARASVA